MPITEEQRQWRRRHLGSSDIAAVLGCDPWRTPYDIWLDKTGQLPDFEPNEEMEIGTILEDGVLTWAEKSLGMLLRNQSMVVQGLPIGTNIDAIVVADGNPVEAKTTAVIGGMASDEWGDERTDELPDRVILQCHVHMMATLKDICFVPALIGGRGFVMYEVKRDQDIVDIISERACDFWNKYVVPVIAPPESLPSISSIKKMRRIPNKVVDLHDDLINRWLSAKNVLKDAEREAEEAQNALLASLGDADGGNSNLGKITYMEQATKRIDTDRFKTEAPVLFREFQKETKYRVLRFKPNKN
jgi:putative phage-type endonuclease